MLLKAAEFSKDKARQKAFNLNDIAAEAEAIIRAAQVEGEEILAQAQREGDQIRQQAQEQGYKVGNESGVREGREAGLKQAHQEAQEEYTRCNSDLMSMFSSYCEGFDQVKNNLLFEAEQNTVALALAIAEKVVKKTGLNKTETTVENVKAALELINKTTDIMVKVNPRDIEHLKKMTSGDGSILSEYSSISFEIDETVEPGGCEILAGDGKVDGRLGIQIDRIADELLMNFQAKLETDDAGVNEAESDK